jgi:hypothetical protein
MDNTGKRHSAAIALAVGVAAYVLASHARQTLLVEPESRLGQALDMSLLYVIVLLPGVIVGWLLRRSVLEWGFLCGLLSEATRLVLSVLLDWIQLSEHERAITSVGGDYFASVVYLSLPSAVLGAAGGAVGSVLDARWQRHA